MKAKKLQELKDKVENEWGFRVIDADLEKPWGAYFVIHPEDTDKFIEIYFAEHKDKFQNSTNLSPKYLILEPGKRFSWQVHDRRAEIWRAVEGPLGAYTAETDEHPEELQLFERDQVIFMDKGIRHRLKGLDEWGVVAEIWVHTDTENLSDESDIKRIQDDFNR
jgi:mannose-6-phosphate isomerase